MHSIVGTADLPYALRFSNLTGDGSRVLALFK